MNPQGTPELLLVLRRALAQSSTCADAPMPALPLYITTMANYSFDWYSAFNFHDWSFKLYMICDNFRSTFLNFSMEWESNYYNHRNDVLSDWKGGFSNCDYLSSKQQPGQMGISHKDFWSSAKAMFHKKVSLRHTGAKKDWHPYYINTIEMRSLLMGIKYF